MSKLNDGVILLVCVILLFITVACDDTDQTDLQDSDDTTIESSSDCDRTCLIEHMSSYLNALIAHDPTRISVSESLKYTEDGDVLNIGEGLWQTASSIEPDTRLDFADPETGQVASQLVINELEGDDTSPVIYQVRLKVDQDEITEIEAVAVRQWDFGNFFFNVNGMVPQPVFHEPLDPDTRMTREELIEVVDLYMDYLEGKITGYEVPFDDHCARYENGIPTASGKLMFELQSMWMFDVTRRYLVIDEEAGIVWGMFPFYQMDWTLVVGEAFKIIDGNIMMIEAVMKWMPANTWE
jgi:hypothetical protein